MPPEKLYRRGAPIPTEVLYKRYGLPSTVEQNGERVYDADADTVRDSHAVHLLRPLADLLADSDLCQHLLTSHTFLQGKAGLYESVLSQLMSAVDITLDEVAHWQTLAQLPQGERSVGMAILVPLAKSKIDLNHLVSSALSISKSVWLIAPPASIHKHLLMSFDNFFIFDGSGPEFSHLRDVVQLPENANERFTSSDAPIAIFATNCGPLVEKEGAFCMVHYWVRFN